MMTKHPIYLGDTIQGERFELDFDEAGIRFVLLVGMTGSGKSIFHTHLYKELMAKYTPAELGFVFMDMTRVDFVQWNSEYLVIPTIVDKAEALSVLETLKGEKRTIFVHIEECDMVYHDRARFEKAIERILNENKNIYIVYSTSRIDPEYFGEWMDRYVDMKVVFAVPNEADSRFLLGNNTAASFTLPGERIVAYQDKQVRCMPIVKE
jgi:hypothetical protein